MIATVLIFVIMVDNNNIASTQSGCSVTRGQDGTAVGRYSIPTSCFSNVGWAIPVPEVTPNNLETHINYDYDSPIYFKNHGFKHAAVDLVGTLNNPYKCPIIDNGMETPVFAIGPGEVKHISRQRTTWPQEYHPHPKNNSLIVIEHTAADGHSFLAYYGHVYAIDGLKEEQDVTKGQKIGALRQSGSPTHIHFEINTELNHPDWRFGPIDRFRSHPPREREGVVNPLQYLINNPGQSAPSPSIKLTISSVDISRFPRIDTYLSVTDADGAVIKGLTVNHFKLTEQSELEAKAVEQNIDVTTVEMADNVSLALAIDRSGSMSSTDMRNAKNAANTIADNLSAEDRSAVISFATSVRVDQSFTGDKNALKSAINALSSGGWTALYDAIYTSVELTSKEVGIPVVLAFTDGKDEGNVSKNNLDEVINFAQSKGVPVYCIGLGEVDHLVLQKIADETGGTYHYTPDSAQLEQIYKEIAASIQDLYFVTYRTHNTNFDGTKRTIEVTATVNQQSASDSITYTVAEPLQISLTGNTKEPLKVQQPGDNPITIEANILSALGIIEAKLFYRVTGSGDAYSEAPMSKNGIVYNAVIPGSAVKDPGVDFYITATDGTLTASSPETLPAQEPHQIPVFPNEKPIVIHDPVETADVGADIIIRAQIIDDTDYVERVVLRYRQSGKVLFQSLEMNWLSPMPGGFYEGVIPSSIFITEGLDYYIVAEDNHGVKGYHGIASNPHTIACEPTGKDINARIDQVAITPAVSRIGEKINLQMTFTNTDTVAHTFIAEVILWEPGSDFSSSDQEFWRVVTLEPGQSKTESWTCTVNKEGDWAYQFAICEAKPFPIDKLVHQYSSPIDYFTVSTPASDDQRRDSVGAYIETLKTIFYDMEIVYNTPSWYVRNFNKPLAAEYQALTDMLDRSLEIAATSLWEAELAWASGDYDLAMELLDIHVEHRQFVSEMAIATMELSIDALAVPMLITRAVYETGKLTTKGLAYITLTPAGGKAISAGFIGLDYYVDKAQYGEEVALANTVKNVLFFAAFNLVPTGEGGDTLAKETAGYIKGYLDFIPAEAFSSVAMQEVLIDALTGITVEGFGTITKERATTIVEEIIE